MKPLLHELPTCCRILQQLVASLRILTAHVQKGLAETNASRSCTFFLVTPSALLMIALLLEALWFTMPLKLGRKKKNLYNSRIPFRSAGALILRLVKRKSKKTILKKDISLQNKHLLDHIYFLVVNTLHILINTTLVISAGFQPMFESLHKSSVFSFRSFTYRKKSRKKENLLRTAKICKGERGRLLNICHCELNHTHTVKASIFIAI